ncbi:BLOC-1-related complex subunit 8 homolog [Artemia franciscana]|uniref:Protein MEF2BNB n=1 Tax=Artemia franciscana TaxID=6661 RepID=A0AA88I119_ARTSF|nr:hypothetical protein QYM36_006111 [Artemia franciscana]KAK2718984.1 hypothetical protein QYM36_006111 [Artemia franciscana]
MASLEFEHLRNPETEYRARKTAEKLSENTHLLANEPSLAMYRLQEHVRRSLPVMIETRQDCIQLNSVLQGGCYDTDLAHGAIQGILKSEETVSNIKEHLKNAIFFRQQLLFEEKKRLRSKKSTSVYKRFSSQISSSGNEVNREGTGRPVSMPPGTLKQ